MNLRGWMRGVNARRLPYSRLNGRWISADRLPDDVRVIAEVELARAAKGSGWNPKVVRLRRALHMIDLCADGRTGGLHSVYAVLLQDHPLLDDLNALGNAPRVVKTLYRKATRLAHERATESWDVFRMQDAADTSWREYLDSRKVQA